jgi:putative ABC transport system permease protein
LALALLTGAGLLIKSFQRVQAVDPGYNPENVLTMTIPLSTARYPLAQWRTFIRDLLTRVNALPGVKVAAVGPLPLWGRRDGSPPPGPIPGLQCCYSVSPDYFRALGLQLRAGRGFTEQDNENAPLVAVINGAGARLYGGESPIGKRDRDRQGRDWTFVGVVADVKRYGLEIGWQNGEIYHSVFQGDPGGDINLLVRTAGDPLELAPAVRQHIWAINPNLPILDVMSMEQRLAESVAPRRFQMLLFGAFAVLALAIATVGIYGVISFAVSQRTHEIGIRMALGAQASDVLRMVIWRGVRLALIGMVLGLAAALALTRVMKNLLFEVRAMDPATLAGVALLLVGAALIASYIPARRATKVDPLQSLRHE